MTFNEIARHQFAAFEKGEPPEGGMEQFGALRKLSLDGSPESLVRLDAFVMELHANGYADEIDLDDEPSQNFLYFVAFYLGKVAASRLGIEPNWISWEVLTEANPQLKDAIPEVFGTSVMCALGTTLYIPLSVVMARLYEGDEGEKSLGSSVDSIVASARSESKR